MFTTEQCRRSSLHEIISHLCLEKTRHARFLRYVYAPVESTEISTPCQKLTSILIFLVGYNIRHTHGTPIAVSPFLNGGRGM